MGREAGLDECVFPRLQIEHGDVTNGAFHRESPRRRMVRSRFAEGRILGTAHRGRQPDPPVAPEHRIVVVDARLPDPLAPKVSGGLQRIESCGMTRTEIERHAGVAHRSDERGRDVLHRIENRQSVGAVLGRSNKRAVTIHRREATIARNQIVQILFVVHPVAERDDDVALDALWSRRLGKRQFPHGNPIRPVTVVGERHLAEVVQLVQHLRTRLARLNSSSPRIC